MKELLRENWLFCLVCLLLIATICYADVEHQEYLSSLTEEERIAYETERYNSRIQDYEVVDVFRYIETRTNKYGGVVSQEVCYGFNYIDNNGNLVSIEGFRDLPRGMTCVELGDRNHYVIDGNKGKIRYLYLTKETLENINTVQ